MAELLKYYYNDTFFKEYGAALKAAVPGYNEKQFFKLVFDDTWDGLELKQRMHHLTKVLHQFLSGDYEKDVSTIREIIAELRKVGAKENGFIYFFLPNYIEQYGVDHPEISIPAFEFITQFCTCEFAVRPFIKKYPERMLSQMFAWSRHNNHLVRRLSSEGCRPRLPWGMALQELKKDPLPIIPILENLKCDPSETVRKSVANNLNDISKDNPQLVIKLVKEWQGLSKETDWIVKHACRTVLRKADPEALSIFGFSDKSKCSVDQFLLHSSSLKIGDHLKFSFSIKNLENNPIKIRVEYGIDYVKSNGKCIRKLFKITENVYEPGREYPFIRKQSLCDMTTRKHHPGLHRLVIVLNGKVSKAAEFKLER